MRRRRALRVVSAILLATGGALVMLPGHTSADGGTAPEATGWWWKAQASSTVTIPAPPTVPEGGFMVEGAPDGAAALAALKYTVAEGEANPTLTLKFAEGGDVGADQAILLACQAGSGWTPGAAQPWEAAPSPACEAGNVAGVVSDDGLAMTFALGSLQFGNQINIILVPGVNPTVPAPANNSVFNVVFDKPGADSLSTTEGFAPLPTTGPATVTPTTAFVPSGGGALPSFTPPASSTYTAPAPIAALPATQQGLTATAPVQQALTAPTFPVAASSERSSRYRLVGLLVLLAGAAAAIYSWRLPVPALNGLSRFGQGTAAPAPVVAAEVSQGGLGRFARPRQGAPPRLT